MSTFASRSMFTFYILNLTHSWLLSTVPGYIPMNSTACNLTSPQRYQISWHLQLWSISSWKGSLDSWSSSQYFLALWDLYSVFSCSWKHWRSNDGKVFADCSTGRQHFPPESQEWLWTIYHLSPQVYRLLGKISLRD